MIIPNVVVHHLWISVPCVAFVPEIGTVQTWIMMHRICVCLHTDSMRSVIECRGDWLQLSHLEVESIEENCMSVECSEPSWLCTKMWISIVFYSSCEFKQWILAVVWTIAVDSYWIPRSLIACKITLLVALCDRTHQRKMIIPNIVVHHLWLFVPCVPSVLR